LEKNLKRASRGSGNGKVESPRPGYTVRIVRFTQPAPVDPAARPKGVALTTLALAALTVIYLVRALLQLFSGTPAALPLELLHCLGLGVVLLLVWNYWKGQNWGRIFVLLTSFVIAVREISSFIDRNGDLASLMSRPLRFFNAILAVFLLYFLNTRPVRAWFKKMSASAADLIADHLVGKLCTAVERRDLSRDLWSIAFEHDAELTLNCPWRIVLDNNLAFASRPPPEIASGGEMPWQLVQNLRVKDVRVAPHTSDLFIAFEMGIELQSWSADSHTQQWRYSDPLLTVLADSDGLTSQAIAAPAPGEEPGNSD
jgi:hypothetical protein